MFSQKMVDCLNKAADAASRNKTEVALSCGCTLTLPESVQLPAELLDAYNILSPHFADHQKAAVAEVVKHFNQEHASLA